MLVEGSEVLGVINIIYMKDMKKYPQHGYQITELDPVFSPFSLNFDVF